MVNPEHMFHVADYCIFGLTLVISLGIGVYYAFSGDKQRTTSEYFVGNRNMAILPVALSLMVTFESSIMMLGTPAEIYVYGLQWIIGQVGFCLANALSIIVIVPLLHPLRITSAYEYLEMRFESHLVRTLGTILGILSYLAYVGIVLYGPATALEAVTGLTPLVSIVSVALAASIYTAIGGLKAVIWTDVFQCLVMFTGFFAFLIKGTIEIGGIGKTWDVAYSKGRVNLFNFDPDPTVRHTFWCLFVGNILRGFSLVFNQSSVQRISATATISAAKKVMYIVAPAYFTTMTLASIEGIIAFAYYDAKGCDPLASKQISNPNQIMPYMVMDMFHGLYGVPGLFMASLFSASLSTMSSGLNSMSALIFTDLVKPHTKPMSEFKATLISKILVFVLGGLTILVAFMTTFLGGTLIQIGSSIVTSFGGPVAGMFLFGAFCPWGNDKGAFWGGILSAIITFVICVGQWSTEGAVKNAKLPPGPIDSCPAYNLTSDVLVTGFTSYNITDTITSTLTTYLSTQGIPPTTAIPEPTGISRLFMVSYQWFATIGTLQVMLYGTIISLCTGRKKPGEVDRKFLVPFFDSLFPFLPERIRKPLRLGYEHPEKPISDDENGEVKTELMVKHANETNGKSGEKDVMLDNSSIKQSDSKDRSFDHEV